MSDVLDMVRTAGSSQEKDQRFPHAPSGWTMKVGMLVAKHEGIALTPEHWEAVRDLQAYYARHETSGIQMRELHDALDEAFHARGGIKHLYQLFPRGPVAQGCRLAGLTPPVGATDRSFGSVG